MKLQAFLPLITYPDANSDRVAANATALAAFLGADLHAGVFNVDIPNVSNALSRLLMKLPDLIRETEVQSRARGEHLLAMVKAEASERAIHLTTSSSTAGPAFLGEAATSEARYYDLAILAGKRAMKRHVRRRRLSLSGAAARQCCYPPLRP